ncbi:hypothetical protein Prudu_1450S000500, partial [Prunus dulcis]
LSLFSPVSSLSLLSLSFRAIWVVRPFAFQATARPPQAEPISAVGTIGSASVSPSQPDQPPPRGRPELAEKSYFPTERFSDLLFMDNQASEVQPISRRNLQRVVEVHRIHHRATLSFRASKSSRLVWIS